MRALSPRGASIIGRPATSAHIYTGGCCARANCGPRARTPVRSTSVRRRAAAGRPMPSAECSLLSAQCPVLRASWTASSPSARGAPIKCSAPIGPQLALVSRPAALVWALIGLARGPTSRPAASGDVGGPGALTSARGDNKSRERARLQSAELRRCTAALL